MIEARAVWRPRLTWSVWSVPELGMAGIHTSRLVVRELTKFHHRIPMPGTIDGLLGSSRRRCPSRLLQMAGAESGTTAARHLAGGSDGAEGGVSAVVEATVRSRVACLAVDDVAAPPAFDRVNAVEKGLQRARFGIRRAPCAVAQVAARQDPVSGGDEVLHALREQVEPAVRAQGCSVRGPRALARGDPLRAASRALRGPVAGGLAILRAAVACSWFGSKGTSGDRGVGCD
jgi:hypothetical protein